MLSGRTFDGDSSIVEESLVFRLSVGVAGGNTNSVDHVKLNTARMFCIGTYVRL